MLTLKPIIVTPHPTEGYFLPKGFITISGTTTLNITFPGEAIDSTHLGKVYTLRDISSILLQPSVTQKITLFVSSDITEPVFTIDNPNLNDIAIAISMGSAQEVRILSYKGSNAGWVTLIFQHSYTQLPYASTGTGLSMGMRRASPYDTFTTVVRVLNSAVPPAIFSPFTTYIDRSNGMIYTPLPLPNTLTMPTLIVAIHSLPITNVLSDGAVLHLSRAGFKQTNHLTQMNSSEIVITIDGYVTIVNDQPAAAFTANGGALIANTTVVQTAHTVDYSSVVGLDSATDFQYTGGYFKGGNNLWDEVSIKQGLVTSTALTKITVPRQVSVTMASLLLNSPVKTVVVTLYITANPIVTADHIVFRQRVTFGTPLQIVNIRLAPGEAIYLKLDTPTSFAYRSSSLIRT